MEAWKNFKGDIWKNEINVADFIKENYTEYKGDDSFLVGKSEKTSKVWEKCEKLLKKEMEVGLLDVELKRLSGINTFFYNFPFQNFITQNIVLLSNSKKHIFVFIPNLYFKF